jgi:hypothetical protein
MQNKENPIDCVKMDIPFLIRIMEYAKEDAKTDMDLHSATEKMIGLSKNGKILTMYDYDAIFKNNINENTTKKIIKKMIRNNLRY